MSGDDLQGGSARHRGFAVKAREVLLEPPAPFAVVAVSFLSDICYQNFSCRRFHCLDKRFYWVYNCY